MIVFYKNYKRTDRVLLSIQSVKHLFPELEVRCLMLYDETPDEYNEYLGLFEKFNVLTFFDKKKYNFGSHSVGMATNGFYFSEGINKIFDLVKDLNDKVVILDEDEFFTTGETLRHLLENDFDLACYYWHGFDPLIYSNRPSLEISASMLAIRPPSVAKYFPLPEQHEFVEIILGHELHDKCINDNLNVFIIPSRYHNNYMGDGIHTNDINEIIFHLEKFNIPYTLDL